MLCPVRLQLTRLPLRVAEQLHTLRAVRQPRHLSGLQGELHGRGAAAAVSVLRPVRAALPTSAHAKRILRIHGDAANDDKREIDYSWRFLVINYSITSFDFVGIYERCVCVGVFSCVPVQMGPCCLREPVHRG